MSSRRTLLSAISAGAAVSVAGCLTDTTRVDAYIQFNRVQMHNRVTASSDGTTLTIHSVDGLLAFSSDE
jgi:hypothetical protein